MGGAYMCLIKHQDIDTSLQYMSPAPNRSSVTHMTSNATEIHDKTYWCALNRNWHYVCDMWITWLTMIWLKGPIFMMFWNCSYMSRRVNWPMGKSEGISMVWSVRWSIRVREWGCEESEEVRVWGEWGSEGVMEWWCAGGSEEVRVCRVRVWWNDGVQERVMEWWSEGI